MTTQDIDIREQIAQLVETNCRIMGLELWGLEYFPGPGGKKGIVRIYIDSDQGVNIEQCAELSRQLSIVFDVEDIIPGSYHLEVSSPGLDRLFFKPSQVQKFLGQKVRISLKNPVQGRKNFSGKLAEVDGQNILIESDSQQWKFHWNEIDKAKLAF